MHNLPFSHYHHPYRSKTSKITVEESYPAPFMLSNHKTLSKHTTQVPFPTAITLRSGISFEGLLAAKVKLPPKPPPSHRSLTIVIIVPSHPTKNAAEQKSSMGAQSLNRMSPNRP